MSFDTLKEAILKEARTEAERVSADLRSQKKAEERRVTKKAHALEEEIIRDAEYEADRRAKLTRQEAELAGRAMVLKTKESELAKTKEDFVKSLLDTDEADTKDMLRGLLELIDKDSGTIVPGDVHRSQLESVADGYALAKDTIANEGGFVFKGKDMELNLTVTHLTDQLFQKHRSELAKMLFE